MTPLRVLSVASEIYPIIKTGGLADVAGALPIALEAKGIEVCTLVPGYPEILRALNASGSNSQTPSHRLAAKLACCADDAANSICLFSTRRICLRAAEILIFRPQVSIGPITACVLLRLLAWPPILVSAPSHRFCPILSMPMIGRPRLCRPILITGIGRVPGP